MGRRKRSRKQLRVSKLAAAASTAVLLVGSPVLAGVSAAGTNDFTLTADKYEVSAGDKINVTVAYEPDSVGAAGFTLILHYDPSEVQVYVPNAGDPAFNVNSDFTVITNYGGTDGVVKMVGANLASANITNPTDIALAQFTVLDGAEGDIDYWLEVDTVVAWDGDDYVNAPYSAADLSSPLSVEVEKDEPETTTFVSTLAAAVTTPQLTEAPETAATTTTAAETTTTSETEPVTTTAAPETTTQPATTTAPVTSVEESTETSAPAAVFDGPALFTYEKTAEEDDSVQFGFDIADYIKDHAKHYDVTFNFDTTGYINGGIGTTVDGKWASQGFVTENAGISSWTYKDLDPMTSSTLLYMQVYYLSNYSTLNIRSVTVAPSEGYKDETAGNGEVIDSGEWYYYEEPQAETENTDDTKPAAEETAEEIAPVTVDQPAQISTDYEEEKFDPEINYVVEKPTVAAVAEGGESSEPETPASTVDEQQSEAGSSAENSTADDTVAPADDNTTDSSSSSELAPVTNSEADNTSANNSAKAESAAASTAQTTPEKVVNTVSKAADAANANPNTGAGKQAGLTAFRAVYGAAFAELVYSLFALIYNKSHKKRSKGH